MVSNRRICLKMVFAVKDKEGRKNKKYYISAKKSDDKWMFILKHNLFYVYKSVMN